MDANTKRINLTIQQIAELIHDLKNQITTTIIALESLKRSSLQQPEIFPPKYDYFLKIALSSAYMQANMVNDFGSFCKIIMTKHKISIDYFDLIAVTLSEISEINSVDIEINRSGVKSYEKDVIMVLTDLRIYTTVLKLLLEIKPDTKHKRTLEIKIFTKENFVRVKIKMKRDINAIEKMRVNLINNLLNMVNSKLVVRELADSSVNYFFDLALN